MRMYSRYAENNNLKVKIMDIHETGVGGLKSATFSIEGPKAYGIYKYEGGVHRVQRIPKTESGGRVHTSAATVAVLPEAEIAEVEINDSDIKIDTYRASGAGGQHVNKTESAIRLTHIPTGLVVTCQDESSQHKNKASAMKVLRSRLFALEQEKLNKDRDEMRKSLVSTGDRSAKIRTYNFPQGRITDHRINYTTHKLQVTLEGELNHLIEQLKLAEESAKIE
jgi:peptide chain release factor 1